MRTLKELRDPRINGDMARPELVVKPRLDEAAQLGVTVASIGDTVRLATLGDLPQNGPHFALPDRQIAIRVSLIESARSNLSTIENLPVRTAAGATVPLKAVADLGFGEGPSRIRRYNQQRRISVDADLNNAQLGTALDKIRALPIYQHLPPGVQIVEIGTAQYMKELFDSFVLAIVAGVLMVFAVLVLLFARVFQPITILSALPLSIGGAVLALWLTTVPVLAAHGVGYADADGHRGEEFDSAGRFCDRGNARRQGSNDGAAGGRSQARAADRDDLRGDDRRACSRPHWDRPSGSSFQAQMAVAVIGGLITSTGLTLVIVPAVFTWIDDLERWLGRKVTRHVDQHAMKLCSPNHSMPDAAGALYGAIEAGGTKFECAVARSVDEILARATRANHHAGGDLRSEC
jgi:hypothetical protein